MNDVSSLLWTQLWQVTVVAVVVFLCVRTFAKNRPHLAHALWVLVLLKCITPPVFSSQLSPFSWMSAQVAVESPVGNAASPAEIAALNLAESNNKSPVIKPSGFGLIKSKSKPLASSRVAVAKPSTDIAYQQVDWKWILFGVWLAGAIISISLQLLRLTRFICHIRRTQAQPCPDVEALIHDLALRLGLRRKVRTVLTHTQISPAVIGLFRPTVLLPASIVERQSNHSLQPLIAHELIHIRRGDLWWALLQTLAGSLFWFHPLVRFAVASITRESERSCDEETIASLKIDPAEYARSLLDVLEQKQLQTVPALPGVKPVEITSARLERVMKLGHGRYKRTPWWTWMVLIACCAIILPGASLVGGQEPKEEPQVLPKTNQPFLLDANATLKEKEKDKPVVVAYVVEGILESMQKANPTRDMQELELHLLRRLRGFPVYDPMAKPDPKEKTVLHDGKAIAIRTKEGHAELSKYIERIHNHGFRQIVLETRILAIPKGTADQAIWAESRTARLLAKNGEVRRELVGDAEDAKVDSQGAMIDSHPVKFANLLEGDTRAGAAVHRLCKADVHTWPVFESSLEKEQLTKFLQRNAGKVTQSPTVTLFDGSGGVISDHALRPFVTNVLPIKSTEDDGLVAHQPVISLLPDGTSMTISSELIDDNQFRISGDLVFSQIKEVNTFTFHPDGSLPKPGEELSEGVTIQLPVVSASKLDFDSTIKADQTLALRTRNPMAPDLDLIFLITPTLVDDPTLPEPYALNDDVQHFAKDPEFKLVRESVALKEAKKSRRAKMNRFKRLCVVHGVSASEKEIDHKLKENATRLGVSVSRFVELVCENRGQNESQVRENFWIEACYQKLPAEVQKSIADGTALIHRGFADINALDGFNTLVIRSQDKSKNWKSGSQIVGSKDNSMIVQTAVDISIAKGTTTITGDKLQVCTANEQPYVAADHLKFEFGDESYSISLSGNSSLYIDDAPFRADSIRFHMSEDEFGIELRGKAKMAYPDLAMMSADEITLDNDETILLKGNAELRYTEPAGKTLRGKEIKIREGGRVMVDGVDKGSIDESEGDTLPSSYYLGEIEQ